MINQMRNSKLTIMKKMPYYYKLSKRLNRVYIWHNIIMIHSKQIFSMMDWNKEKNRKIKKKKMMKKMKKKS